MPSAKIVQKQRSRYPPCYHCSITDDLQIPYLVKKYTDKCNRKRPCNICIRHGLSSECKPQTLQKKSSGTRRAPKARSEPIGQAVTACLICSQTHGKQICDRCRSQTYASQQWKDSTYGAFGGGVTQRQQQEFPPLVQMLSKSSSRTKKTACKNCHRLKRACEGDPYQPCNHCKNRNIQCEIRKRQST